MGRPSYEQATAEVVMDAAWSVAELPRMFLASDSAVAAMLYDALRWVRGDTPDERLDAMWIVLDGHELREPAERFLARQWDLKQKWTRRITRHDERTSA